MATFFIFLSLIVLALAAFGALGYFTLRDRRQVRARTSGIRLPHPR